MPIIVIYWEVRIGTWSEGDCDDQPRTITVSLMFIYNKPTWSLNEGPYTSMRLMHLSMSSPTTPRAGHIGGCVGICTSGLWNPHPLGGFRIYNPWLTDKRSLPFWKRTSLNFVFVMQEVLPRKLTGLFRLPDKVWRYTINTVFLTSIRNNYMICNARINEMPHPTPPGPRWGLVHPLTTSRGRRGGAFAYFFRL